MAEVFLCASIGPEGFEKDVVLKKVRGHLSGEADFVSMFIDEARLASRLNHPNIVQIFEFGKHEDTYFLAMEYVRGHSLREVRSRCKQQLMPMPVTLSAHVGAEVARALHHAHRLSDNGRLLGIVHRDVSPINVMVSLVGAVKLLDFGIAKSLERATTPGVLKGKLGYMSPEQARGEKVDARTDVFALGIVLWELLTGGRLFDADSDMGVIRAVTERVIPPPARLNPDVPAALDDIVMQALQRDPAARFQTAQEMERRLAQFVLEHASHVDETDLAAFLRRVYGDEEPHPERAAAEALAPQPVQPVANPDEDVNAQTEVLKRKESAASHTPTPVLSTPGRASIGMRRALVAGGALFVVIGAAAAGVKLWPRPPVVSPSASPTGLPSGALPVVPRPVLPEEKKPPTETAAPVTPAQPERRKTGILKVQVSPWAYVHVAGKRYEVSTLERIILPVGRHRVRMENPAHNWTAETFVDIRPGAEQLLRHSIPINDGR